MGNHVAPKERPRLTGPKKTPELAVKTTSDVSKRAGQELPKRLRADIEQLVDESPEVTLATATPRAGTTRYTLDASITDLSRTNQGPWVEVACNVKLAISTRDGRILSIVTGGAKVQTPKRAFKPSMEPGLQVEALDNAVRGAFENLLSFLARQVALN